MSKDAEVAEVLRLRRAVSSAPTVRLAKTFEEAAQDRVLLLLLDYGLSDTELAQSLGTSKQAVRKDLHATRKRRLGPLAFSSTAQMGRWAQEARLRKKSTPEQVGQAIGMSGAWVQQVENGQPVREAGALPVLFKHLGLDVRHFAVRG